MRMQAYVETELPLEMTPERGASEEVVGEIVSEEAPLVYDGVAQALTTEQSDTPEALDTEQADRLEAARQRRHNRLRNPHRTGEDSIAWYLSEIGVAPLLTKEQEIELAQTIEAGHAATEQISQGHHSRKLQQTAQKGKEAKDTFVRSNLRLVVSVAKKYPLPPGMEFLDLVQEGNLGLEHAVDKFEWQKGFKFSTYATFWIRQAIGRALDQKSNLIRLRGNMPGELRRALAMQSQEQNDSSGEQLEGELGLAYRAATPASLDKANDDEVELSEVLPSPIMGPEEVLVDYTEKAIDYQSIEDAARDLNPIQRRAVELRFLMPDKVSYRAIGEELGLSPEGARRNVMKGLEIIRNALKTPPTSRRPNQTRQQG